MKNVTILYFISTATKYEKYRHFLCIVSKSDQLNVYLTKEQFFRAVDRFGLVRKPETVNDGLVVYIEPEKPEL